MEVLLELVVASLLDDVGVTRLIGSERLRAVRALGLFSDRDLRRSFGRIRGSVDRRRFWQESDRVGTYHGAEPNEVFMIELIHEDEDGTYCRTNLVWTHRVIGFGGLTV